MTSIRAPKTWLLLLFVGLLAQACGRTESSSGASVDPNSVSVIVHEPLTADCSGGTLYSGDVRAGSEGASGGKGRYSNIAATDCSGYVVEVSGSVTGSADSVIVTIGGNDYAADLKDGKFTLLVSLASVEDPISITPMISGEIGSVFDVASANIQFLQ